jgi:hypothetical protein
MISSHLVAAQSGAEGVTLTPSQESYEVGEPVFVWFFNGTPHTIVFPDFPGWSVMASDSTYVLPCSVLPLEHELRPGYTSTFAWDQLDCNELQVPIDTYRARVRYWVESRSARSTEFIETWFGIGVTPVEPSTWSQIKILFR